MAMNTEWDRQLLRLGALHCSEKVANYIPIKGWQASANPAFSLCQESNCGESPQQDD
jgi:hypothetical protein